MNNIQLRWILPVGFFLFISFVIYLANTANYNYAFFMVGHIPYGDKIAHALLYGVMALLLNYGLRFAKFGSFQLGSLLVLAFATVEEFSQYYIPSRTFDVGDLLADLVGIVLFSYLRIR